MDMVQTGELLALAKDKSGDARNELTRRLLMLFGDSNEDDNVRERALMFDILQSVLTDIRDDLRQDLAASLAGALDAPKDMIQKMAAEPVDISEPLLQRSQVLTDDDLLDLIAIKAEDHAMSIAGRKALSAYVSDELAMSGNEGIIRRLLSNETADVAELTLSFLIQEARTMDGIQHALASREGLDRHMALRLTACAKDSLKQQIAENWQFEPHEMAALQHKDDPGKASLLDRLRDYWQAAEELAEGLHRHGNLSPILVAASLRSGHVALFLAQIRHMTGLKEQLIQRVLLEPDGLGFAVLAKHIRFGRADFADMFKQIAKGRELAPPQVTAELDKALDHWDALDEEMVDQIVDGWQKGLGYVRSLNRVRDLG